MRTGLRINIIFDSFDVRVEVVIGSRKERIQSVSVSMDRLADCSLISDLLVTLLDSAQHFVHVVAGGMEFASFNTLTQAFNSGDDTGINAIKQ